MITIKNKFKEYGIKIPTDIKEITPAILNEITKEVKLPKHYCVVALCFKTKISDFVIQMKKQSADVAVVPIMAKISDEDSKEINSNVGDKIIIDRTCLERGHHINLKTVISSTLIKNYLAESDIQTALISGKTNDKLDEYSLNWIKHNPRQDIIILEFKICPIVDVVASIPMEYETNDPFIVK